MGNHQLFPIDSRSAGIYTKVTSGDWTSVRLQKEQGSGWFARIARSLFFQTKSPWPTPGAFLLPRLARMGQAHGSPLVRSPDSTERRKSDVRFSTLDLVLRMLVLITAFRLFIKHSRIVSTSPIVVVSSMAMPTVPLSNRRKLIFFSAAILIVSAVSSGKTRIVSKYGSS